MLNNQEKKILLLKDLGMEYPNDGCKNKYKYGIYKCYCGNKFKAVCSSVKRGYIKSCGCSRKTLITNKTSGKGNSKHELYNTWNTMFHRCYNPNRWDYKHYGAIGVSVCSEWFDFEVFIEDMYTTYQNGLTLDRIDNNKGYFKSNCRWATKSTQQKNKRIIQSNNTSGYKGVYFNKKNNNWKAMIKVNKKNIYLGYYNTTIEASKAYDKYIIDNKLENKKNF